MRTIQEIMRSVNPIDPRHPNHPNHVDGWLDFADAIGREMAKRDYARLQTDRGNDADDKA
jgi:hypothetical protein